MANIVAGYEDVTFGRWTVVRFVELRAGYSFWLCKCQCGKERAVRMELLLKGVSNSCGCINREIHAKRLLKHGMCSGDKKVEYNVWATMIQRCTNPNNHSYFRYGAKGVTVCERWMTFKMFFEDMGVRPFVGASLDRIDNARGYEPGNVRWATAKQQSRNRANNKLLTFNGVIATIAEWAEKTSINAFVIYQRILRLGWTTEEALTKPVKVLRRMVLEYDGKSMTVAEWSKIVGLNTWTIQGRIDNGWSVEKALTTPSQKKGLS